MPRIAHERYKYYPLGDRDFPIWKDVSAREHSLYTVKDR